MQQVNHTVGHGADRLLAALHQEPGLRLPAGRKPDTAAELDGTDVTDTLLAMGTPRKRMYGRGNPKHPSPSTEGDYLPDSCHGAGCLAAHNLAELAESMSMAAKSLMSVLADVKGKEELPINVPTAP